MKVDHVIPVGKCDMSYGADRFKCFNYRNIQALTEIEHDKKGVSIAEHDKKSVSMVSEAWCMRELWPSKWGALAMKLEFGQLVSAPVVCSPVT